MTNVCKKPSTKKELIWKGTTRKGHFSTMTLLRNLETNNCIAAVQEQCLQLLIEISMLHDG